MKPYELEIFDHNFNFIYNALIDDADFAYKYDAISPDKSTIAVPKTFQPKSLSNEPRAPKGWYIRIFRDDEEYQGVISGYEEGKNQNTISYSQLITIFDNQVTVKGRATLNSSIESVIKTLMVSNYVTNADSVQNITGLSQNNITTTSSTTGAFDYFNVDDIDDNPTVVINLLNDLILEAASLYNVFTRCRLNIAEKKVYVEIGKDSNAVKTIEADLINNIDKNIVIKKSNKEINKVSIYDENSESTYNFYLHPDGSYSQTDSDRVYPVVNELHTVDTYVKAKTILDTFIDENKNVISEYLELGRRLTSEERNALIAALNNLMPQIREYCETDALINSVHADVDTYTSAEVVVIGDKHISFIPDATGGWAVSDEQFVYPTRLNIGAQSITYNYSTSVQNVHVLVSGRTSVYVHLDTGTSYTQNVTPSAPLTNAGLNAALTNYKNSESYERDIANEGYIIIQTDGGEIAKKAFSSNKYSNCIELTYLKGDTMINPLTMPIGQEVNIIHEGVLYNSILTGREIQKNGLVRLIFGTIRLELTKILNMKGV